MNLYNIICRAGRRVRIIMDALYKCMQLRHILFTVLPIMYNCTTLTYTFKASHMYSIPHKNLYAQSMGNGKKKINVQLQR